MHKPILALIVVALLADASAAAASTTAASPQSSPLPEIYHSVSRPLCSALAAKVRPALAMFIQNDQTIAKSPPLFNDYIKLASAGSDSGKDMSVYRLNQLVTPLVQNSLAIQKLLEDPSTFPNAPQNADDQQLIAMKNAMLQKLAAQQASLDIINGFVQTQQLDSMQHEGFGYLQAITGSSSAPAQPSVNLNGGAAQAVGGSLDKPSADAGAPSTYDNLVLNAGLQQNPYEVDPTKIPGLAVGYNQIGKLREGVEWTQDEGKKADKPLADAVLSAARACGAQLPPASPSPNP
jgi:hypothetical protein